MTHHFMYEVVPSFSVNKDLLSFHENNWESVRTHTHTNTCKDIATHTFILSIHCGRHCNTDLYTINPLQQTLQHIPLHYRSTVGDIATHTFTLSIHGRRHCNTYLYTMDPLRETLQQTFTLWIHGRRHCNTDFYTMDPLQETLQNRPLHYGSTAGDLATDLYTINPLQETLQHIPLHYGSTAGDIATHTFTLWIHCGGTWRFLMTNSSASSVDNWMWRPRTSLMAASRLHTSPASGFITRIQVNTYLYTMDPLRRHMEALDDKFLGQFHMMNATPTKAAIKGPLCMIQFSVGQKEPMTRWDYP